MEKTQQRSLVLILARELADNSATPMFVVDPEGNLVFFNEPAEHVLETARSSWRGRYVVAVMPARSALACHSRAAAVVS